MGWLDDAEAILKQKNENTKNDNDANSDIVCLDSTQDKEIFRKSVKELYEKATDREIDLAIERIENHFTSPYSKKELLTYVRQFVEGD